MMKTVLLLLLLMLNIVQAHGQAGDGSTTVYKPRMSRERLHTERTVVLDPKIPEGSGLELWEGLLWTHNDSGSPSLFALDTLTGNIVAEYLLPGVNNTDWEDMSQDEGYFYIGDFGNNGGNRDSLTILRVNKASLLAKKPIVDKISFTWPETLDRKEKRRINFDCEAMIVTRDSIYLFTKEWKKKRCTSVFTLPSAPGQYTATYHSTLKTKLLITGANYDENLKRLVLCGYSLLLCPRLLVFDNATPDNFFGGSGTKIRVGLPFRQVEGVTVDNAGNCYIVNEAFKFMLLHSSQQIHKVKLAD